MCASTALAIQGGKDVSVPPSLPMAHLGLHILSFLGRLIQSWKPCRMPSVTLGISLWMMPAGGEQGGAGDACRGGEREASVEGWCSLGRGWKSLGLRMMLVIFSMQQPPAALLQT